MRFAFFSCADYTHGYYNAYELLEREDLDFVVCLGDYVYAESYHAKGKTGVRDDKIGKANSDNPSIVREAVSLADYRAKYALYRSDKTLRDLHAKFPMVATWDDHEVQDNYAGNAPGGGLDPPSTTRRAQGRGLQGVLRGDADPALGQEPDLPRAALRQERRPGDARPAPVPRRPAVRRRDRSAVPRARRAARLPRARADGLRQAAPRNSGAAWKVVGNELMMMNAELPGGNYYGFDNWQGYAIEREELLAHIKAAGIKDVVFITGDIHTFIAGDVRTQKSRGESVALEFVGGSITSQSLGETDLPLGGGQVLKGNDANPNTPPAIIDALRGGQPVGRPGRLRPPRLRPRQGDRQDFDVTLKRLQTIKRRRRRRCRPRASATRSPAARRRSRASTARPSKTQREVFFAPGCRQDRVIFGSCLRPRMVTARTCRWCPGLVTCTWTFAPLDSLRLRPKRELSDFLPFLRFL